MDEGRRPVDQERSGNGKTVAGLFLLLFGAGLLLRQLDVDFFPDWLISWPMLLVAWGLYMGFKNSFRDAKWLIVLLLGLAFLAERIMPGFRIHQLAWPLLLVALGLWLIFRRNHAWDQQRWQRKWERKTARWQSWVPDPAVPYQASPAGSAAAAGPTVAETDAPGVEAGSGPPPVPDDYLDAVSVFGGVKKTVLSRRFRGGDIVNVFGGAEIDLSSADIDGRVVIDITQLFGGTKLIVPPHWQVISNLSAVFSGVDDKRLRKEGDGDAGKVLVLQGVSVFAGIDIRSF